MIRCFYDGQGRISNIGKLGTCLGRQLCRGSTPTKKKKMWKTNSIHLLHSHLTLLQYRLIWCQNDGNFISFLPVLLLDFYKLEQAPLFDEMLRKKGTLTFLFFWPLSQNFQEGNGAHVNHCSKSVTFFVPSKRVGAGEPGGDSTHRGAAIRPVPRGSTHLKSGPVYEISVCCREQTVV